MPPSLFLLIKTPKFTQILNYSSLPFDMHLDLQPSPSNMLAFRHTGVRS